MTQATSTQAALTLTSHCRIQRVSATEVHLVANRAVASGTTLMVESPLLWVAVGQYRWGTYCWDLVDVLLADRNLLKAFDRCDLATTEFLMTPADVATEAALARVHRISNARVRSLFFRVGTNNLAVLDERLQIRGHGLFPKLSRSDHSCIPSAELVPAPDDPGQMALRALRDLSPGEPVTWSYFGDERFFAADYETRNTALVNLFRFVCRCPRCKLEQPPQLARERQLMNYFDRKIAATASVLYAMGSDVEELTPQSARQGVHYAIKQLAR